MTVVSHTIYKYVSHSVGFLLVSLMFSFAVQKLLSLIKSYLFKFLFLFPLLSESDEKDFDAGRDWGQEEKGMTEDEMAGWHYRLDGREFE